MMSRSFTKREKILLLIMAVLLLGLVYYRFVIVETANAVERYDVSELESELLVEQMKAYGFHMDDVNQGYNLTPVITETEGLIRDGKIRIGANNLLKINFYNTALKLDTGRNKCMIVKSGTRTRIDGVAAFLDAMTVRQKWHNEIGQQLRNPGK